MFKFLKKIFIIELEFFFNIVYDEITQTGKVSIMAENTSTRLKAIMAQRGLKQADILRLAQPYCEKYKIKMGKSDLSQFVSGKVEPGQWKLTILGLALDVSEAWLMGLDVPMERETTPASLDGDGRIGEFVGLFCQLTAEQQALIIAQIKGILSAQ
ncbi:transcriptional regulator [uncultured Oscillibacter sp.]|uniref:transcriptional regulator n=2 Tax=uncultured Oscillibacter sp. TaxID=876091 RepID=UPI002607D085|nr:transcriptional regulator [uncultured Oscillibacter sp.]